MLNMKKLVPGFFCMCLLLLYHQAAVQVVNISGTVTNADDGTSLPGVSILVKGSTTGVSTDIDGRYSISAERGSVLVFSFIGMVPQERAIGAESVIDVVLQAEAQSLDEVVVVGYGTQRRSDLTGAVSTVDTKVLESRPITDAARG